MPQVLDDNQQNWLIMTDDGSTTTKTKASPLNQLLYEHDLWGLLESNDEIWMKSGREDEPSVKIIPNEDERYTINITNAPDLTLGAHKKTDLIDAMVKIYDEYDGESVAPIIELYDSIREDMIRDEVLSGFLTVLPDKVAEKDDGWFINGHVLLTFEGEFFHPNTNSRKRSGQTVLPSSSEQAYQVDIGSAKESMSRNFSFDGANWRLTDKEVKFLAKAMWALKNTEDKT